jgi:hypothetical protein
MKRMEFKEIRLPEDILAKIEAGVSEGKPITLGDAGVFDWLTKLSATEGWRPVWQAFNFPFVVLEREVGKS